MSNTPTTAPKEATPTNDPGLNRLAADVRTMGSELKAQAVDTKEVVVNSAKTIAADTKAVAQANYIAAKEHLREKSRELTAASEARMELTRQRVVQEPLKALAIAAGVGFFLGRFIFNGR